MTSKYDTPIDACCRNRHLPFEALRRLTDDKYKWLVNTTIPGSVLRELWQQHQQRGSLTFLMRADLLVHPNTPVDVLDSVRDPSDRLNVAKRRHLPDHLVAKLINDPEVSVRYMLACNDTIPKSAHQVLALDEDRDVRVAATRRLTAVQP